MEYFCGFVCFERAVFFRLCITWLWNVWLFDCNAIVFARLLRCETNTFHGAESRTCWYHHEEHGQVQPQQAVESTRKSGCAGTESKCMRK